MHKEVLVNPFSIPQVEKEVEKLDFSLLTYSELQAPKDAKLSDLISPQLYKVKVLNPVQDQTQQTINEIRRIVMPASMAQNVLEYEHQGNLTSQSLFSTVTDKQHEKAVLEKQNDLSTLDLSKFRNAKLFGIVVIIAGLADSLISYGNLRQAYSTVLSISIALAIGLAISFSHHAHAFWIRKAETERKRNLRISIVLLIGFAFFMILSSFRGVAVSRRTDINLDTFDSLQPEAPSFLPIAIASFMVFAIILFGALRYFISREERLRYQEYLKTKHRIQQLEKEIKELEAQESGIRERIIEDKSTVRKRFEYAVTSIRKCKHLAAHAVSKYNQVYARHRGEIPDFFAIKPQFDFDDTFQVVTPPKNQKS